MGERERERTVTEGGSDRKTVREGQRLREQDTEADKDTRTKAKCPNNTWQEFEISGMAERHRRNRGKRNEKKARGKLGNALMGSGRVY